MTLRRRVVSVLILALAGLIPLQASRAQAPGSELIEEVASHEVGENAQVRLEDVAAFDPGGGEAIFEPGTSNEEAFSYDSVDAETNRLIGLTRAAPLHHPQGAFVESVGQEPPPSAEPSPAPTEEAEDAPSASGGGEFSEEASASESASEPAESSSGANGSDQTSEASLGVTCFETQPAKECVEEAVGEVCSEGLVCDIVGEILNDPCGFVGVVCTLLNPCDPDNTGQTCEQWLQGLTECQGDDNDPPTCDIPQLGVLGDCNLPLDVNACLNAILNYCTLDVSCPPIDLIDQTLVQLDDTEYEILPEAIVDEFDLLDGAISDAHCTAVANAPFKSAKYTVKGVGEMTCPERMAGIGVSVTLQMLKAGKWTQISPTVVWVKADDNHVQGPAHASCKTGKKKYRTVAVGQAKGYDEKVHKDVDRSAAVPLPCPIREPEGELLPPLL